MNTHTLPTINRFRNEGVQATQGMKPTYVTMTFPNHISIATGTVNVIIAFVIMVRIGMYEEDHGIINNRFFDRLLNKTITIGIYIT